MKEGCVRESVKGVCMRDTETEKRHWHPVYAKIKIVSSSLPVGPAPQEAALSPSLSLEPSRHPLPITLIQW